MDKFYIKMLDYFIEKLTEIVDLQKLYEYKSETWKRLDEKFIILYETLRDLKEVFEN